MRHAGMVNNALNKLLIQKQWLDCRIQRGSVFREVPEFTSGVGVEIFSLGQGAIIFDGLSGGTYIFAPSVG